MLELLSNIKNTIKGVCRTRHLVATLPAPGALLGLNGSYGGSRRGGIINPFARQSYPSSRREDTSLSLSHSRIRHSYLYLVHIHSSISIFNFILISIYSTVIHCMWIVEVNKSNLFSLPIQVNSINIKFITVLACNAWPLDSKLQKIQN